MKDLDHCDWQLVLQELLLGQDAAANLHASLSIEDGSPTASHDDLARAIAGSFAKALCLLGCRDSSAKPDGTATSCFSSTNGAFPGGPDAVSGGKIDGRGRYKRRKSCDSWSETTPAVVYDGHAWRKYGQKKIHCSDFPRSYYRCTHKPDQNCQAVKQVQQISEDPPFYRTTYYGHHTCKNASDPNRFILPEEETTFKLVYFDGEVPRNTVEKPSFHSKVQSG
ncbi:hypothetical protein MLD38_032592 [Melastoma candidum]|uniref:Uncharacterized protein n=1 Tax=Melastoma candidum TaxID=119954 RepID=A0ACB9M6I1_9MYRT|nr:hypothetical protein MLD38_032592 [Melastoma candidum]